MLVVIARIRGLAIGEAVVMPAGGLCGRDEDGFWACYLTPKMRLRRYRTASPLRMACWWYSQYTNQPLKRVIQQHAMQRMRAGIRVTTIAREYDISRRTVVRWLKQPVPA